MHGTILLLHVIQSMNSFALLVGIGEATSLKFIDTIHLTLMICTLSTLITTGPDVSIEDVAEVIKYFPNRKTSGIETTASESTILLFLSLQGN